MSIKLVVLDHDSGQRIGTVDAEITPIATKILSDYIYPTGDTNSALCITAKKVGVTGTDRPIYEFGFYGPVTPEVLSLSEDGEVSMIQEG